MYNNTKPNSQKESLNMIFTDDRFINVWICCLKKQDPKPKADTIHTMMVLEDIEWQRGQLETFKIFQLFETKNSSL